MNNLQNQTKQAKFPYRILHLLNSNPGSSLEEISYELENWTSTFSGEEFENPPEELFLGARTVLSRLSEITDNSEATIFLTKYGESKYTWYEKFVRVIIKSDKQHSHWVYMNLRFALVRSSSGMNETHSIRQDITTATRLILTIRNAVDQDLFNHICFTGLLNSNSFWFEIIIMISEVCESDPKDILEYTFSEKFLTDFSGSLPKCFSELTTYLINNTLFYINNLYSDKTFIEIKLIQKRIDVLFKDGYILKFFSRLFHYITLNLPDLIYVSIEGTAQIIETYSLQKFIILFKSFMDVFQSIKNSVDLWNRFEKKYDITDMQSLGLDFANQVGIHNLDSLEELLYKYLFATGQDYSHTRDFFYEKVVQAYETSPRGKNDLELTGRIGLRLLQEFPQELLLIPSVSPVGLDPDLMFYKRLLYGIFSNNSINFEIYQYIKSKFRWSSDIVKTIDGYMLNKLFAKSSFFASESVLDIYEILQILVEVNFKALKDYVKDLIRDLKEDRSDNYNPNAVTNTTNLKMRDLPNIAFDSSEMDMITSNMLQYMDIPEIESNEKELEIKLTEITLLFRDSILNAKKKLDGEEL